MNWKILNNPPGNGIANMDADVKMFEAAQTGQSTIRFYSWDGPWVSLGKFQRPEADLIDPGRIPWVIRPTGGQAVLHGHDLTVTIACPVGNDSVRQVYRSLIAPLAEGMRRAGQPAMLGEETSFVSSGKASDCFKNISANDVVDPTTGRKLIGCALRVTRNAALAQCSIPMRLPLVDPAVIYRRPHVAAPLAITEDVLVDAISIAFLRRSELASGGA